MKAAADAAKKLNKKAKAVAKIFTPPNITPVQKFKEIQRFLCFIVVCRVYGSGEICRKLDKFELVHDAFNKELQKLVTKSGMWEDVSEYNEDEYSVDQMRKDPKGQNMTGEQIWNLGMTERRKDTDLCSGPLGKVLKFKTLKPPSDSKSSSASDSMVEVEEADFTLVSELASDGTDELALKDFLLKVCSSKKLSSNCYICIYIIIYM